jgi:hypothetical protein
MECNELLFPAPASSYNLITMPKDFIFIPMVIPREKSSHVAANVGNSGMKHIPCLHISYVFCMMRSVAT